MRAWLLDSYAGVAALRLGVAEPREPQAGEVRLRLHYAALNPADAFLAQNLYPAKPVFPHILGRDGAGEISATGPGVTEFHVGEQAGILRCEAGVNIWGTLAEEVVVPAVSLAPVPYGWTLAEMAAAPLVFLTAWQALTQWGPRGGVLLVTGASGGVGTASVILGKSLGFTVVALSRSAEKSARLRTLGADFTFDPAAADLRKQVQAAIAPHKVDLAIDTIGGALFAQVIALLGQDGAVSVVGRSAGPVPEFNTATLFFRRNRIGGVSVGAYTPREAQAAWREIVRRLDAAGRRPVIDSTFPFEEVPAAFARLAAGPLGKVLVAVR
jgi:NADPH2:quinone reductase